MVDYLRYTNIIKLIEYRGYPKPVVLTEKQVMEELYNHEFVKVVSNGNVFILFTAENNSVLSKSSDLEALIYSTIKEHPERITINLFTAKPPHPAARTKLAAIDAADINCYSHLHVSVYVPGGIMCEPHRILSEDEKNKLLFKLKILTHLVLPEIYKVDPQCIWLGAKEGDIIEITGKSISAGLYTTYKVVVYAVDVEEDDEELG